MAQLTVRNVPDDVAAALKARAARAGRSAEAEHRRILEEALRRDPAEEFVRSLEALRVRLPPGSPSTTEMIREDRDRDDREWDERHGA